MDILEKFAIAQKLIVGHYPMLSTFYSMCNFTRITEKNITLRLNTKTGASPIIEYNKDFIDSLRPETLALLISIELFRLILHHPTTRLLYPIKYCYRSSNVICTDESILNYAMEDYSAKDLFPSKKSFFNKNQDSIPPESLYLEYVFGLMIKDIDEDPNDDGKESKEKDKKQSNESSDDEKFDELSNQLENNSEEDEESNEEVERKKETDALKRHFSDDNVNDCIENWGENSLIDEKITQGVERISNNKKMYGTLSDNIKQLIELKNRREYDPRAIFSKFVTSVFSVATEFTRMRPPRRLGQDYTGIIYGSRHKMKAKVLIALDSSGSMEDSVINEGIYFMQSALKHADVYFCWWDTQCYDITHEKIMKPKYEVKGRGGTNPQCIIDKLKKEKLRFDGIVVISDCVFDWYEPPKREKVCIVSTSHMQGPKWCKWFFKLEDLLKRIKK